MTCQDRPSRRELLWLFRTAVTSGAIAVVLFLLMWVSGVFPNELTSGEVDTRWYTWPSAYALTGAVGMLIGTGGIWFFYEHVIPEEREGSG